MSKKLPIFYSALLLTGVNLLLRSVSTSFQVYLSGVIGAEGIGLLQLVMSVGFLALTLSAAGVRTTTMYLSAEEIGRKRPQNVTWVLSGCFAYSIVCSTILWAVFTYFAPFIAQNWLGDPDTVDALKLLAAFLPINCLCGVMTGYFTAANRIGTLAAVEVAEQLLSMVTTLLLLHFWAGNHIYRACQSVILGSSISGTFTVLLLIFLRIREHPKTGARIPIARRIVRTAVPLALADDLKSGISTVENLMVPKRLSLYPGADNPLALFGTVSAMVFPVMMFPAAILFALAELLIPELARCAAADSKNRIQYLVKRSSRLAFLYGFTFSGLLYLFAKPLCLRLYDSAQAGYFLERFSLLVPMLYSDAITDAMLKGLGQQTASVRYNIFTSGLDVIFLYLLLPAFGMDGYFFSFLLTHLINYILSIRRLQKVSQVKILPKQILLMIIATALSIILASRIAPMLIRGGAFLALMFSMLFLMGVVTAEDITWVKSLPCKTER